MIQKVDDTVVLCGLGRVNDNQPIDIMKYSVPTDQCSVQNLTTISARPDSSYQRKIDKTVYDINIHFDTDGTKTILQQFRDLILSANSQN